MKIVKQYDPRVKTTYVYEVLESHYDPSKKQTRSTRKLIGKLDEAGFKTCQRDGLYIL